MFVLNSDGTHPISSAYEIHKFKFIWRLLLSMISSMMTVMGSSKNTINFRTQQIGIVSSTELEIGRKWFIEAMVD